MVAAGVFTGMAVIATTAAVASHAVTKQRASRPRHAVTDPVPATPTAMEDKVDQDTDSEEEDEEDEEEEEAKAEAAKQKQKQKQQQDTRAKELQELRKTAKLFDLWLDYQLDFTPWLLLVVQKIGVSVRSMPNGNSMLQVAQYKPTIDALETRDLRFCGVQLRAYSTVAVWQQLIRDTDADISQLQRFSALVRSALPRGTKAGACRTTDSLLDMLDAAVPSLRVRKVQLLFPPPATSASSGSK